MQGCREWRRRLVPACAACPRYGVVQAGLPSAVLLTGSFQKPRTSMTKSSSELGAAWWAKNLDDVDREIARLATICNVRILDAGVIERVLKNDESVCGSKNPRAFDKLLQTLMMHYHVRDQAVGALGEEQTRKLVTSIVESL